MLGLGSSGSRTQGAPAGQGKWGEKGPPPHLHIVLQALEEPLLEGAGGRHQGLLQLSKAFWELGQKVSPGEGEGPGQGKVGNPSSVHSDCSVKGSPLGWHSGEALGAVT